MELEQSTKELEKLEKFYSEAGVKTQLLGAPLLNNAIFMAAQLDQMRKLLNKPEDWVSTYQNGRTQHGTTTNPIGKQYMQLMKTFTSTLKTLYALLPPETTESEDEFTKWVSK